MKKLIFILSLSFMLAGEMEVDGDLNVSGDIQSPTIAQLQEIIAQLEAQIALMQDADNKLETRLYEKMYYFDTNAQEFLFDLQSITGYELENAIVNFYSISDYNVYENDGEIEIYLQNEGPYPLLAKSRLRQGHLVDDNNGGGIFDTNFIYSNSLNYIIRLVLGELQGGYINIKFAITAQFPETRSQK